jgi:hypothetical protein
MNQPRFVSASLKSIDAPRRFLDHESTPAVPRLLCPQAIDAKWIFLKNPLFAEAEDGYNTCGTP